MKLPILLAGLLGFMSLNAQEQKPDLEVRMRTECDEFLQKMPKGLQQTQARAVRLAIDGDNAELQQIRDSRNKPAQLPDEVVARMVKPGLCLFTPRKASQRLRPVLLYLHGGGWAFGSINSCARFCAAVALYGDCCVAALDYRLAPEHPYPAAFEDSREAIAFLKQYAAELGCDSTRISVGGDSAGGNLALTLGFTVKGLRSIVPIYPVTKVFTAPSLSWSKYEYGFGCDADLLEAFNTAYAHGHEREPEVSPALATDAQLRCLPPVLLISAERDILADQGREMAERLKSLGVDVTHQVYAGSTHLFITVPGQPTAFSLAVHQTGDFLNQK